MSGTFRPCGRCRFCEQLRRLRNKRAHAERLLSADAGFIDVPMRDGIIRVPAADRAGLQEAMRALDTEEKRLRRKVELFGHAPRRPPPRAPSIMTRELV